jgi:hypothetical protein
MSYSYNSTNNKIIMNNGGKVNTGFLACTTQSITTRMEATE